MKGLFGAMKTFQALAQVVGILALITLTGLVLNGQASWGTPPLLRLLGN